MKGNPSKRNKAKKNYTILKPTSWSFRLLSRPRSRVGTQLSGEELSVSHLNPSIAAHRSKVTFGRKANCIGPGYRIKRSTYMVKNHQSSYNTWKSERIQSSAQLLHKQLSSTNTGISWKSKVHLSDEDETFIDGTVCETPLGVWKFC